MVRCAACVQRGMGNLALRRREGDVGGVLILAGFRQASWGNARDSLREIAPVADTDHRPLLFSPTAALDRVRLALTNAQGETSQP